MSGPATIDEFLNVVHKSGVLDRHHVDHYLNQLRTDSRMPSIPLELARVMLRDGLLTRFQAEQLLRGRWRRLIISGKYRLLAQLGAGGTGSVFLGEHIIMRRQVALKVLPPGQSSNPACLGSFYRAAPAVSTVPHPHTVSAY